MGTPGNLGPPPSLIRRAGPAAWAMGAGAITLAAGLGGIQAGPHSGREQLAWISVATTFSILLTGAKAVLDARRSNDDAVRARELQATVVQIDSRMSSGQDQKTRALLARIIPSSARALTDLADDPGQFGEVVQDLMRLLCLIVRKTRHMQHRDLRVFLLEVPPDFIALGTEDPAALKPIRCHSDREYPQEPRFQPTASFCQEIETVMMRNHPYQLGLLVDDRDGRDLYPERHTLEPAEHGITSYIRVGVPGFGVLGVDSWNRPLLEPADREICLAFAELIELACRIGNVLPDEVTP
jgi:hypothetical protein